MRQVRQVRQVRRVRRGVALVLGFVLACHVLGAQEFPPPTGKVNDFASLLPDGDRQSLEDLLASLERDTGAEVAVVTVSGLEGRTVEDYANRLFGEWGIGLTTIDLGDLDGVRTMIGQLAPTVLWLETPSNPMMKITDVVALAEIAHAAGVLVVVDNTFATPHLQTPLALGADVVVHSTTKYLGGHSDVIGGALVTSDAGLAEALAFHNKSMGAVAGPFDSWLALRGVKTLAVRMDRHCDNAERIVDLLVGHPRVSRVYYPGLPAHAGHEIAARQMRRFGGMVSFRVAGERSTRWRSAGARGSSPSVSRWVAWRA